MSLTEVTLVAVLVACSPSCVDSSGLVETISDYAKVVKNTEEPTTRLSTTEPAPEKASVDYEDFDDLQEDSRSLGQTPESSTMTRYFKGIVSLLALMSKLNGKANRRKTQTANEPRENKNTGKRFQEAQDRFEFPQKKFKYHGNADSNRIDQQFQPVENYPPYNPLAANSAETYNKDDKKTSYDADLSQYDSKNAIGDYSSDNLEVQQSHSYEIPYETPQAVKQSGQDDWSDHIHPVYQPWMSKTPDADGASPNGNSHHSWMTNTEQAPANVDSYHSWIMKTPNKGVGDSYHPWVAPSLDESSWKTKTPSDAKPSPWSKPEPADLDSRQPHPVVDFPVYHHDFHEHPPFEDHLVDEDRVSKKPYSYYFLGRKLWYIPLLFSVYFIIYIGALVLKSVARHKIQFPEKIWNLHEDHYDHNKHRRHRKIDEITENYQKAVDKLNNKFM